MPPPKSNKTLTAAQKETLKRWIAEGAEYQPHWSFIAPTRPDAARRSRTRPGCRNPIDRFVLAEAGSDGPDARPRGRPPDARPPAQPRPDRPAARRRREVEAFVNDTVAGRLREARRPAAGVAALGRAPRPLLARRRPLRRHARHPLRQLPRDLGLPRLGHQRLQREHAVRPVHDRAARRRPAARTATLDQQIATGFNRCNITTNEGGAIDEEYLVLYARDRTETTVAGLAGPDDRLRASATTTSSTRSRRRSSTRCRRSSTTRRRRDGRQHQGHAADHRRCRAPRTAPRWDALAKEIGAARGKRRGPQAGGPRRVRQVAGGRERRADRRRACPTRRACTCTRRSSEGQGQRRSTCTSTASRGR